MRVRFARGLLRIPAGSVRPGPAHVWLQNGVYVQLGSALIGREIFEPIPFSGIVEFARLPIIEELTVK